MLLTTYEKGDNDEVTVLMSNKKSNKLADNETNQNWPSSDPSFSATGKTTTLVDPATKILLPTKKQPTGTKIRQVFEPRPIQLLVLKSHQSDHTQL